MKAFFYSRQFREKLLLTGFLLLAAVIWFSNAAERGGRLWREWRAASTVLANQRLWLNQRDAAEQALTKAVAHLDPARTFNGATLQAELSRITDGLRVSGNTTSEITGMMRSGQLAVHTVNCMVRPISQRVLLDFVEELHKRSPYIGIEQFTLTVANNYAITVNLRISSVEIVR